MLSLSIGLGIGTQQAVGGGGAAGVTFATGGTNKSANITLSSGNLEMVGAATGVYQCVRATRATTQTGAFEFEMLVNTMTTGNPSFGIEDGTVDFSTDGNVPGDGGTTGAAHGCFVQNFNGNWYIAQNGNSASQGPFATPTPANGNRITVRANKGAGTIAFYVNGTQIGVTCTGVSYTNWFAFTAVKEPTDITANFAGSFVTGTDPAY